MTWAGAHAEQTKWIVVVLSTNGATAIHEVHRLGDVLASELNALAVDVPIGLVERKKISGGRRCEIEVRSHLGEPRRHSFFPSPVQAALFADSFREASAIQAQNSANGRGICLQTFALFMGIRDVREWVKSGKRPVPVEAHAELSFNEMAGRPTIDGRSTEDGGIERMNLLRRHGIANLKGEPPPRGVLDAAALAWTARRVATGEALPLPTGDPDRDCDGIPMVVWR